MKSRYALGIGTLVGLVVSAWRLYPVFQAMTRGYVLEYPRLSTLGCRQIHKDDAAYWDGVMANSVLGLLSLAATVAALLELRALYRPAPVLQTMRADVQRMRDRLTALERGRV